MQAAVYTGQSTISVEQIATPEIGPGELLGPRGELRNLPHRSEEDRV